MLIQVPLFSESLSQIKRPLPPSDPPTSQDIVDAIVLLEKVKEFFSPPSFERRLLRDYCMATVDDLAKAQLYLHKVCSVATAETGGNHVTSHLVEPMDRRLDQMDETLVPMMNTSRIHGLEQRLDSDSQISEHRQRSGNPEAPDRSPVESTHWLYDKTQPFNDLQLYHQIPISWGTGEDKDPEHVKYVYSLLFTLMTCSR
ncbi:hypothetical protein C8R48DRAFT_62627 [Suillus tomentosus]|nr:hypothetical protein C8R48DRAFT_62627 [Suillus tomentosus]